jgi:4-hydroxybenzoate polyprenyltransferase
MENDIEVEASIIKVKAFFLLILVIVGTGTIITWFLSYLSTGLIPLGLILFWFGPFIIMKSLRAPYVKKMDIKFSNENIGIKLFNQQDGDSEEDFRINYSQIQSFKVYKSTKDDSSFLKIVCKDRPSISYTFVGQSNDGNISNITSLFVKYVHAYNDQQEEQNKITLTPSLFASKKGRIFLAILTALLVALLIFQIVFKPVTIPFSIFASFVLTIQIISQRNRDIRDLKEFNSHKEAYQLDE